MSLDEKFIGWNCCWMKVCWMKVSLDKSVKIGWNRFWMKVYSLIQLISKLTLNQWVTLFQLSDLIATQVRFELEYHSTKANLIRSVRKIVCPRRKSTSTLSVFNLIYVMCSPLSESAYGATESISKLSDLQLRLTLISTILHTFHEWMNVSSPDL